MNYSHKITVAIPFHWMEDWQFYLFRALESIEKQTFKDYEVRLIKTGSMPVTSNAVIEGSNGELIKILYMDDYFTDDNSLQKIVDAFQPEDHWLVTGCLHQYDGNYNEDTNSYNEALHSPHYPSYRDDIYTGNNGIGSPSVLTIRNEGHLLFDTELSYLLDCDLYKRYHDKYGLPRILNDLNVVIGLHKGQVSNIMPNSEKQNEYTYVMNKYAK